MKAAGKKIIAGFMDYPTPRHRGKITDALAESMFEDWNSLGSVIQKIKLLAITHPALIVKREAILKTLAFWDIQYTRGLILEFIMEFMDLNEKQEA